MFNIATRPCFDVTVTVSGQEFGVTFEALSDEAVEKFDLATAEGERQFLRRTLLGIDDVFNGDRRLGFEEARELLLGEPICRLAMARAYGVGLLRAGRGN